MPNNASAFLLVLFALFGACFALTPVPVCFQQDGPSPDDSFIISVPLLNNASTCLNFTNTGNFVFDCNGSTINYTGGAGEFSAIYLENVTNVTFMNCIITNWDSGATPSRAIELANVSDSVFSNISVNNSGYGVQIRANSNNVAIRSSNFTELIRHGAHISGGNSNNILVENSFFDICGETCIYSGAIENLTLRHNRIINSTYNGGWPALQGGIVVDRGHRAFVYNNTVLDSIFGHGIALHDTNHSSAYGNLVGTVRGDGIALLSGENNSAYGNVVYGAPFPATAGISGRHQNHSRIYNNTVYGSSVGIGLQNSHNTSVSRNLAYDSNVGFQDQLSFATYNVFDSNVARNCTLSGFEFSLTNGSLILNNTAHSSGTGMLIGSSQNATVINNTLYNNLVGLVFDVDGEDTGSYFGGNLVYGNTDHGLRIQRYGPVGASPLVIDSITFRNATGGNDTEFTVLDIRDSLVSPEAYQMSWSPAPAALPPGFTSFHSKFVEIEDISNADIQEVQWAWTDAESAGWDESLLQLWEYNGASWSRINSTPDTVANTLTAYGLTPNSVYGILLAGEGPKSKISSKPRDCIFDSDCLNSCYYCSFVNDVCMLKETSQCGLDSDCAGLAGQKTTPFGHTIQLSYVCENCQCVGYECTPDSPCPPGYTCEGGNCIPPECFSSSDCPSGYECSGNNCVKKAVAEPKEKPSEPGGIGEEPLPPKKEEPPLPKPSEIAKEVVPLVEGTEPVETKEGFWDTIITGAWVLLLALVILGLFYAIIYKKRKKERE